MIANNLTKRRQCRTSEEIDRKCGVSKTGLVRIIG